MKKHFRLLVVAACILILAIAWFATAPKPDPRYPPILYHCKLGAVLTRTPDNRLFMGCLVKAKGGWNVITISSDNYLKYQFIPGPLVKTLYLKEAK